MADRKPTRIFAYRGTPVYAHRSMIVFGCVALLLGLSLGAPAFVGMLAYLGITVIHEFGHAEMARRVGSRSLRIDLYPFHGLCTHTQPRLREHDYWIAWGGVLAQLPFLIGAWSFLQIWGRTSIPELDLALIVLVHINGVSIVLNLMPLESLDGVKASKLIPLVTRQRGR